MIIEYENQMILGLIIFALKAYKEYMCIHVMSYMPDSVLARI